MIKTRVYASISKEYLHEKGIEVGLKREALEMFKHFNEVELDIEVEDGNGLVLNIRAINQ